MDQVAGTANRLTVSVGGETIRLSGDHLVEVIRRPRLTRVPHGPAALVGVGNLRGAVLPVVSLAQLLGRVPGAEERVVVMDNGTKVGLLVDSVLKLAGQQSTDDGSLIDWLGLVNQDFRREETAKSSLSGRAHVSDADSEIETRRVLVSFSVGNQLYALPLQAVLEVLTMPSEVSGTGSGESSVLGVANIRNRTIPLISMAALLGLVENGSGRIIIIVEHDGDLVGLAVGSVESILRLPETAVDTVPAVLRQAAGTAELDAIGRTGIGQQLVSILSVEKLFGNRAVGNAVAASSKETAEMEIAAQAETREQFVIFDLGGELYGLPIGAVVEIIRLPEHVTRVPNAPEFVSGVVNLRGKPLPIIDQRQRFAAPEARSGSQPRVVVVGFGTLISGFVVDRVIEIAALGEAEMAAAPSLSAPGTQVFSRVASLPGEDRMALLLDAGELLTRAEQDVITDIAARQIGSEQP
ncbi:MAG: chemotaxis protein CheW [Candidatus Devosia phytovorans]|uniref:Chemotaxis protein CheW n=1 Tax=Candidatus Devosia phytovorans TaxID=3121372 RepID=A0AAJ5VUG0_9HYPH|nr:chemotaxis protein CheW [Devosia sp.]WEK04351.1 MAG: chemotaxis protein CheW [Devosia sp.]